MSALRFVYPPGALEALSLRETLQLRQCVTQLTESGVMPEEVLRVLGGVYDDLGRVASLKEALVPQVMHAGAGHA